MPKKVVIQSILTDASGREAFISFDRNPLAKEKSTFQKLMWVEGLLNTIKGSGLPIENIQLLIHHKPLSDAHLDFTHPWPISGYGKSGS